jgi:hypothetical protein
MSSGASLKNEDGGVGPGMERIENHLRDIDINAKTLAGAIASIRTYVLAVERSLVESEVDIAARVAVFSNESEVLTQAKTRVRTRHSVHLEYKQTPEGWAIVLVKEHEEWVKEDAGGIDQDLRRSKLSQHAGRQLVDGLDLRNIGRSLLDHWLSETAGIGRPSV